MNFREGMMVVQFACRKRVDRWRYSAKEERDGGSALGS